MVSRLDLGKAKVPRMSDVLLEGMAAAAYTEFMDVYRSMFTESDLKASEVVPWEKLKDEQRIAGRAAARAAYKHLAMVGGAVVRKL